MAYLTPVAYEALTIVPTEYVDDVQTRYAGWLEAQLEYWSSYIDARLAKRYATPFGNPCPVAVTGWLSRLVDPRVMIKRGVDSTDAQFQLVIASADAALAELKEAADTVQGLYDLPLRADTTASGIVKPRPLSYSEASPYAWSGIQRDRGRYE